MNDDGTSTSSADSSASGPGGSTGDYDIDGVIGGYTSGYNWQSGNIGPKNTEAENNYIQAPLEICDKERIGIIFPSRDPDVYVCSKNKQSLKDRGILTPVPELDILLGVLDKGRTIELAQTAGFPCPKTIMGYSGMDISTVVSAFGPPWIIKPGMTR